MALTGRCQDPTAHVEPAVLPEAPAGLSQRTGEEHGPRLGPQVVPAHSHALMAITAKLVPALVM